ncbi:DciA family protein [Streptomyces jumonjinensis]|uniref:DUF721 domain-containing protein n=1 Tax=Streptomyces jumonjinensis TaxID=1945 RepID=A0A646KL75_STRJU|nr:DciA family protein [Streptomyces jumonjinensis]MQT02808.1 DUF721 domain-containing protein [Streptomyces jumonjinensis]
MTDNPTHSGADLARQALAAYKAGHRPGTTPAKPRRRTKATRNTDGRDPKPFAAVLARLGSEQGWAAGVRGGDILDRWTDLCPQYDGRVHPAAYDPDTGRLDLRPASHAYATQLRLLGGQLCRQINTKIGSDAVRSIRVLPVAHHVHPPTTPSAESTPSSPAAPVRTRETASAGYHRALTAHQTAHPRRTPDPAIAAADHDQIRALRDHREPENAFTDARALEDQLTVRAQNAADTHTRALAAARAAKAGRQPTRLFSAP